MFLFMITYYNVNMTSYQTTFAAAAAASDKPTLMVIVCYSSQ